MKYIYSVLCYFVFLPLVIQSQSIDGGYYHTVFICSDSTVWATGRNNIGQLGDGTYNNSTMPVKINELAEVIEVAAGGDHTLALKADGTVWSWGLNSSGQLGNNTIASSNVPVQVMNLANVYSITTGENYSLALKNDGSLWTWGNNNTGQLGDGTTDNQLLPIQVSGLSGIITVAAGKSHSLALKEDGSLWAWGSNTYGQFGDSLFANSLTPVLISTITDVKSIAAGMYHSLAIKNNGTVWAWGYNGHGVIGNGTTVSNTQPVQLADSINAKIVIAGQSFSMVISDDSTLKTWGNNKYGQIGNGSSNNQITPFLVAGMSQIEMVESGTYHSIAVKNDGTVWSWGFNNFGQLGDSTMINKYTPVELKTGCAVAKTNPVCGVNASFSATQTIICSGETVVFTNNSTGASNYIWEEEGIEFSTNPEPQRIFSVAGNYGIRLIANPGFCADTTLINITVNPNPDATIAAISALCASDAPIQLTAATSGGTWAGTGVSSSGLFDPTLAGSGTHSISYSVTAGNCSNTDTEDITVNANPDATIAAISALCAADAPIQLTAATSGGTWSGTGVSSSGLFDPTLAGNGTHSVSYSVTDGNCSDTDSEDIIVNPLPQAVFSYSQNGYEVNFINSSSDAASYEWHFGDSTTSILSNPLHTYVTEGVFEVVLSATNLCGSSTASAQITIISSKITTGASNLKGIIIYPNPNSGQFSLIFPGNVNSSTVHYKVFDILGKELIGYKKHELPGKVDFDLTKHPAGIYFLKIYAGSESVSLRITVF